MISKSNGRLSTGYAAFALGLISAQLLRLLPVDIAAGHFAAAEKSSSHGALFAPTPVVLGVLATLAVTVLIAVWLATKRDALAKIINTRISTTQTPPNSQAREQAVSVQQASFEHDEPNTSDEDAAEARAMLDQQLEWLIRYASAYLENTQSHSETYAAAQQRLTKASNIEQVQLVVKTLVATVAKAKTDTEEMRRRLEEAQTQSKVMRDRLQQAETNASLDALTGLANRRSFDTFLNSAIAKSHAEGSPLSVILADIDHFKAVNDKFGHASGDAAIKTFAQHLKSKLRPGDLAARYGGEEFVLILPKTPLGNAGHMAETIRREMPGLKWIGAPKSKSIGTVTASFGVSEIRDHEDAGSLVQRADKMLYKAKAGGRNQVVVDHNP